MSRCVLFSCPIDQYFLIVEFFLLNWLLPLSVKRESYFLRLCKHIIPFTTLSSVSLSSLTAQSFLEWSSSIVSIDISLNLVRSACNSSSGLSRSNDVFPNDFLYINQRRMSGQDVIGSSSFADVLIVSVCSMFELINDVCQQQLLLFRTKACSFSYIIILFLTSTGVLFKMICGLLDLNLRPRMPSYLYLVSFYYPL